MFYKIISAIVQGFEEIHNCLTTARLRLNSSIEMFCFAFLVLVVRSPLAVTSERDRFLPFTPKWQGFLKFSTLGVERSDRS
jgi:hypothetical protein